MSLSDLNHHLFAQLDRLSSPDLDAETIASEAERARAIVSVADQVSTNARLQLEAAKLFAAHGQQVLPMLPMVADSRAAKVPDQDTDT